MARWAGLTVILAVLLAAPAAAKPRPIPASSAFFLPSAQSCVAGSTMKVGLRKVRHVKWLGATVKIGARRVLTIKRSQVGRRLTLRNLPASRFTLTISARAKKHRSAKVTRTFRRCQTTTPPPINRPTATPTPTPTPTPSPTPAPASVQPGTYSGGTAQGRSVSFYVPPGAAQLRDVAVNVVTLGCAPTRTLYDQLAIGEIAIDANHGFSATTSEDGVLSGAPAHFTYTFSGHFTGPTATGTLRERITFDDGTAFDCDSDTLTWSVTRDTQGTQTAAAAPQGTYSGGTAQGRSLSFYVSSDHAHLQDVAVNVVTLGCTPGNTVNDQLAIGDIALAADGSFSATTTEDAVLSGAPAHFTYTFKGHLHGPSNGGVMRVGGTLRERITYDDGTAFDCNSNTLQWYASRDNQGAPTTAPPPAGTYSGGSAQGRSVSFYLSTDHAHLQDVSVNVVTLACTPAKTIDASLAISDIAIAPDGSFSATTTEEGVLSGVPAHFTFTFSGHLHGPDASGVERIGGTLREHIALDDGTTTDCSSNTIQWSASRDAQGLVTGAAPPAGAYSGGSAQGRTVTFTVSSDKAHLQDVAVNVVTLGCTPLQTVDDKLAIADVPIASDGSFAATTEHDATLFGTTAHITYTFGGHVHGPNSSGVQRLGGTLRERITYDDGTAHDCTSNTVVWTALRSG